MKRLTGSKKLALIGVPLALAAVVAVVTIFVVGELNDASSKSTVSVNVASEPVQAVRDLVITRYSRSVKFNETYGATVVYHVAGYDFAPMVTNSPTNSVNLYPASQASTDKLPSTLLGDVTTTLHGLGYDKATDGVYDPGIRGIGAYMADYFVHGDTVCEWLDNVDTTEFTCVGRPRLVEVAQAAQPFAAGLAQSLGAKQSQVALAVPAEALNSKHPTYEHAIVSFMGPYEVTSPQNEPTGQASMEQAAAYFYRPAGTANWIYQLSSQEGLGCWELSGTASQAFSDICLNGGY